MKKLEFPIVLDNGKEQRGLTAEIQFDDPITTCTVYNQDGGIVSYGFSRRKEPDIFIPYIGAENAYKSAVERKDKRGVLFPKWARECMWEAFWIFTDKVPTTNTQALSEFERKLFEKIIRTNFVNFSIG